MAIGYSAKTWVDGSSPALSAANLQTLDDALEDACDEIDFRASKWAGKTIGWYGSSIAYEEDIQPYVDAVLRTVSTTYAISGSLVTGSGITALNNATRISGVTATHDVVIVDCGTADFLASTLFGTIDSVTNSEFFGGLNLMFANLVARFPAKRIVILTPPFAYPTVAEWGSEHLQNLATLMIQDYAYSIIDAAHEWGIPVADLNGASGINKGNYETYLTDGLMPNTAGAKRLASVVIGVLRSIEPTE